ncbi:MAG: M20/M25/M40 family metallo-hydrolase [Bacteroidales bacterium]|nr:M20/M25/M40 family metallo-hydrolase [Bacteroidales bacterium]
MRKLLVIASLALFAVISCCKQPASEVTIKADPVIAGALAQVSADSIETYINDLVAFHTRHNLSTQTDPERGIGAAVNYLVDKCEYWAENASPDRPMPVVEVIRYDAGGPGSRLGREVNLPCVMVTLPGTIGSGEIILMAHIDTRVADNNDSTSFAPGANDDASGMACLLETARIVSQIPLEQTIKCLFVSGEEHGLLGSQAVAKIAKEEGWPILAVINNDMISNAVSSETNLETIDMVRVFSDSPRGEDSDARQWARYIKECAATYVPGHEVKLMYRNDRYRRGGDHTSFTNEGFVAVRMSEYYENYDRTHQLVREENGIAYGDVISGLSVPYLVKNIRVNMAAAMSLASAPAKPEGARIANANDLSNYTVLSWRAVADPGAHYEVLYRETDQPVWKVYGSYEYDPSAQLQTAKFPLSKDNYFYAVRSVSEGGHPSLPSVCR